MTTDGKKGAIEKPKIGATIDPVKLKRHAEFYRTATNDPHGIHTAVYVALFTILQCLSARTKNTNAHKRKKKT